MNVVERNNVRILGKGKKTIMFAHGYGCNQNMWRLLLPAFESEYQIVLFDLVGAGQSDLAAYDRIKYGSLSGYAKDVVEICKDLDLRDVTFVGHSVSAMIGILASIQRPDLFERLVLIGPSPCYVNEGAYTGGFTREAIEGLLHALETDHPAWSKAMAPVIIGNLERPQLAEELADSFCRTKPEIAKHFAQVTFLSDNRADLPKVRVPSLILQCSDDAIAPEAVGRYLHANLKGSTLKIMQAKGHCPHLSSPDETIEAMKVWFASCTHASRAS